MKGTQFTTDLSGLLYFEDSDVLMMPDHISGEVWRSETAGKTWYTVNGVDAAIAVVKHTFDKQTAIILGAARTHWITDDMGESWREFSTATPIKFSSRPISFHASDPKRILLQLEDCEDFFTCSFPVVYTTDAFATPPKQLIDDALSCMWAKTTTAFTSGDEDVDKSRVLCNVGGLFSIFESDGRILMSDDFFETGGVEPLLDGDRPVSGISRLASVTRYLAVAAKSEGSNELALYVTDNTNEWRRAEFGKHKIEEDAYTILESTNYSLQIDVQSSRGAMGNLYTSDFRGWSFTKNVDHTNRNDEGYVDFEKVQGIPGIVLVNLVDNAEELGSSHRVEKDIITKISFDDGHVWHDLLVDAKKSKPKKLHLHSVTDQVNVGRVFSSPAPGIIMGVGNTGSFLKQNRSDCDTFVSDDAGLTWKMAREGPHLYEMGDQGALLVMVPDEITDDVYWSVDHGEKWESAKLPSTVLPLALTTTPDSTSLKFILEAEISDKSGEVSYQIIALDFDSLHEKTCGESDLEDWNARVDEEGEPSCLMGHTLVYRRRKAGSDCFVNHEFKDPVPIQKDCDCTDADYECDIGFMLDEDGETCVLDPDSPLDAPKGECEGDAEDFTGPSGYRKIPGNTCNQKGKGKDEPITRKCKETITRPISGNIATNTTVFPSEYKDIIQAFYLERCEKCKGDDETIVALTSNNVVIITKDHGKNWEPIKGIKDKIVEIIPHQYFNDQVYFITEKKRVYYSKNRGHTVHEFDVPESINKKGVEALSFHPKQPEWLIWIGDKGSKTVAQVSQKHGDEWTTLLSSVRKCSFMYNEGRPTSQKLVYCQQHEGGDKTAPMNLFSSDDFFYDNKTELQKDVVEYATMSEYIVVARRTEDRKSLVSSASVDASHFADVHFPPNFQVEIQSGYTALESTTHAAFLYVAVDRSPGREYGAIIKSNSNGTEYAMSIRHVNSDSDGYVDFEKVQGLEGVQLVNIVTNFDSAGDGTAKKLKTMVSHNDGADWAPISRPSDSGKFDSKWCSGSTQDCSLHLHGFTERLDPRNTFSSPTAIGLLIANGNVGEYLTDIEDCDTFMSSDGGIEWSIIEQGKWIWEYGDRGSIVVIVKHGEATTELQYSLDEGKTWTPHPFSADEVVVERLTSVPSDTSRQFLIWGTIGKQRVTINIDFSGLPERSQRCTLDEKNPESEDDDYWLWSPSHPLSKNNCLFGHVAQYHRKIVAKDCYNGQSLPVLHDIARDCPCERQDFECDWNFERRPDGVCELVEGLEPLDPAAVCANNGTKEYSEPTGYRRIPLTTCKGGKELDYSRFRTKPCDGYEDDWDNKHGISGAGLFFAIVIPILAASAAGWWVWRNWDGKFGRIQLGDGGSTGSRIGLGGAFDRDAPWIKYPVLTLSAVVAVVAAVPMVVSTVWRTLRTRFGRPSGRYGSYNRPYTSRGSFQRSRGNYSVVDPDEGELLGDESEDEAT